MDKAADPNDLVTVLSQLEGMGRGIGRGHPAAEDDVGTTATAGRTGFFRKMLRSLRLRFWADSSAPHKS
jgi:hypothetical protein